MNTKTYFYQDKPLFGLDLGFNSVKVMQVNSGHHLTVSGYGVASYPDSAIKDGQIVDHEKIASSMYDLFKVGLNGDVTTRRVVFSVPAARTFTRILTLPTFDNHKELEQAVRAEAEQYIPAAMNELYLDYSVIAKRDKEIDVMVVAVPQKIINSYQQLADILGLEVVAMESTTGAISRLFGYTDQHDVPTILIDFGSVSADITIYDHQLIVTGTVPGGGDDFTRLIGETLGVGREEAHIIKVKYGMSVSKKQAEIKAVLMPILEQIVKEVRRMVRYYEERATDQKKRIGQIVTLGGGANVPGLSEYLTDTLRLPVRPCNPWPKLEFRGASPPPDIEKSMYITVAGLAMIDPKELFE